MDAMRFIRLFIILVNEYVIQTKRDSKFLIKYYFVIFFVPLCNHFWCFLRICSSYKCEGNIVDDLERRTKSNL